MKEEFRALQIKVMNKNEVVSSFGEESISWNIFPYYKGNNSINYDPFEQTNAYARVMSREAQARIFSVYKEIFALLSYPTANLDHELRAKVCELISCISLEDIKNWIDLKANITIPSVLEDRYVESDENSGNRARTYIKEDYKWLISLVILLRFVTPIWSEYIARTTREKGNNFKEYYAAELIHGSYIEQSIPMLKLKTFVLENIPKEKPMTSATLAALSEEDFPEWVLRLVLVKKIGIDDIRGLNNDSHLIKVIFQFVRQRIRNVDNSFFGVIKEKFQIENNSSLDDSNNISKIEGYKIRQELSAGDVSFIRHSLDDPFEVARRINQNFDPKLLEASLESVAALETTLIEPAQRALVQYVLRPVAAPRAILLLKKVELLKMVAVTQAILWQAGWFDLSALSSAVRIANSEYMDISYTGVRSRISREQLLKLDYLYPYKRRVQGKQKSQRELNVAIGEIERLNDEFTGNDWHLTIPEAWIQNSSLSVKAGHYYPASDLRVKLADMVICIATFKFAFSDPKDIMLASAASLLDSEIKPPLYS